MTDDVMDGHGDSLHTNFRLLLGELRDHRFHVDALTSDFTTFDAAAYGALLLIDSEERYLPAELTKLQEDVTHKAKRPSPHRLGL